MRCGSPRSGAGCATQIVQQFLPETVGDAGLTFTADDADDLARQVRRPLSPPQPIDNPNRRPAKRRIAVVSPRFGDGFLKPDLSAPGVSIFSTAVGTGNGGEFLSGTSMAAPHTTGAAALVVQSHPGWSAEDIRAAIVNTADASQLTGFFIRAGGGGLVQPRPATRTSVVATTHVPGRNGKDTDAETNLSFGVEEFTQDLRQSGDITVRNLGTQTATFNVSSASMVATWLTGSGSSTNWCSPTPSPSTRARDQNIRLW